MSDVIDFIESLGARPALAPGAYAAAVDGLAVDAAMREALLGRDAAAVGAALGGRDMMWCAIWSPDESPADEPGQDEPAHEEPPQPDTDVD